MQEANVDETADILTADLDLSALLESVLFVASGPVSTGRLAKVLETTPAVVESCLRDLDDLYETRGLRLQRSGPSVQLTTPP